MCQPNKSHLQRTSRKAGAFTITELMVAVSLMSLIVLALYAMFNQVQKALRANESQVDSSERGRAVLELVSREIESARVSMRPNVTNFWVRLATGTRNVQMDPDAPALALSSTNGLPPRTNSFDNVYYLTKSDKAWRGVGYAILQPTNYNNKEVMAPAVNMLGTLCRYETRATKRELSSHDEFVPRFCRCVAEANVRAGGVAGHDELQPDRGRRGAFSRAALRHGGTLDVVVGSGPDQFAGCQITRSRAWT